MRVYTNYLDIGLNNRPTSKREFVDQLLLFRMLDTELFFIKRKRR